MKKTKEQARVIRQDCLMEGVYSMWIQTQQIARQAKPGQFLSLFMKDQSSLLPRPISICEAEAKTGWIRIVYRVVGRGTRELSGYGTGDTISVLGPLGNGFPLKPKKALLIGGGIGIPPMLELAKSLHGEKQIVVGYRDQQFLVEDLQAHGAVFIATEDGSCGTKGTVMDAIRENNLDAEIIYACGPTPMLRAVKEYAGQHGIECYLSLEERMACGIGACLACVCQSTEIDGHSQVNNKRICKDGPVFLSTEVEL